MLVLGALCGIQTSSDRSKTKICDPCMARVVYEDVWLGGVNMTVERA